MSSTAVPTEQTVSVAEWRKVFHGLGTENHTSSATFVKQLTVVAMSVITYVKNAFPDNCYAKESFGGYKLSIFKKNPGNELAQFVCKAVTEAFDAIDRKYLHQLAFCVYENDCETGNLIECYIFEYEYTAQGTTMSLRTKSSNQQTATVTFKEIEDSTKDLIRNCISLVQSSNTRWPDVLDMSFHLNYNDNAPLDYHTPGYQSDESGVDPLRGPLRSLQEVSLGAVRTPYHGVSIKSFVKDLMSGSNEATASENPPMLTLPEETTSSIHLNQILPVKCQCGRDKDNPSQGGSAMLTCYYCYTQQHAVCYGYLPDRASLVRRHCCTECSDQSADRDPTDARLAQISLRKRQCLCIYRLLLEWCLHVPAIDCATVMEKFDCSEKIAVKLFKLIASHGVIKLGPDFEMTTQLKINMEMLKLQIMRLFRSNADHDLADRLLAETLGSQESATDPVGDVLSPLDKITLQKTSNLGRLIQPPERVNKVNGDPTLKEYRDAIIGSTIDEDMLLNGSFNTDKQVEKNVVLNKITIKRKMEEKSEVIVKKGRKLSLVKRNKKAK